MYLSHTLQLLEARARADRLHRAAAMRAQQEATHRDRSGNRPDTWLPHPRRVRARPPRLRAVD